MLQQLYIHNFTLIDKLDIHFSSGFSVITGETGAGKSIILGAIGLLLGNRAEARLVKAGTDKCIVEAHFDISRYDMQQFFIDNDIDYEPDDCIMRRELRANGKSRAFINDTPVSLTTARELGEQLVDIHSQRQNLLLRLPAECCRHHSQQQQRAAAISHHISRILRHQGCTQKT